MKSKIFTICLVFTVVAILAIFAMYVRIGATADAVVVMKTAGMTCARCGSEVSKTLQSQKGVAATEIDLGNGLVAAGFDSKRVSAQNLALAVNRCGFASSVLAVVTPEQFRKVAGHSVGQAGGGQGCCGKKGCSEK